MEPSDHEEPEKSSTGDAKNENNTPPACSVRPEDLHSRGKPRRQERENGNNTPEAAVPGKHLQDAVGLPIWDTQRYRFKGVQIPAPRSGGCIELYRDRVTRTWLAVKHVPRERFCDSPEAFRETFPTEQENPWQEMAVAQQLGQPGPGRVRAVCQYHGAFVNGRGDLLLASEYIPGGDLFDIASRLGDPGPRRERQAWPLVRSLLDAVFQLHTRSIAHGDVSVENILRRPGLGGEVVLVDFGMSTTGNLSTVKGVRGKPSYQAPEMHAQSTYDARCADLFACGVAAYALAIGGYPWTSTRPGACIAFKYARQNGLLAYFEKRRISVGGIHRPVSNCLSPLYTKLLLALLDFEPSARYRAVSVLNGYPTLAVPAALRGA